jgi:hypothetical protein
LKIDHFYTALETNARSFGLTEGTTVEKKLTAPAQIKRTDVEKNYDIMLSIEFAAAKIHKYNSRSYITFIDAAGNVGG